MFPLLPLAMRIMVGTRARFIPVSIGLALAGLVVSLLWWRAELEVAVTEQAGWMFEAEEEAVTSGVPLPEGPPAGGALPTAQPAAAPVQMPPPKPGAEGSIVVQDATTECFREHVRTPTDGSPYGVSLADINGDSVLDLVWVNAGVSDGSSIEITAGSRDGTFSPLGSTPYSGGGLTVAVADLDRDGELDVATPDYNGTTVTVWLGGGDGTLRRGPTQKTFRTPFDILAADLNADGDADLVVSHYFHLEVLRGDGKGGLRATPWLRLEKDPDKPKRLLTPEGIAAADLTGDGRLELIIPKGDVATIEVWRANKRGTFKRSALVESCQAPANARVGDVVGERFADVLVHCGDATIELFEGDGAGGLERRGAVGPEASLSGFALADFSGDGRLDLLTPVAQIGHGFGAAVVEGSAAAEIYAGDGKGGFVLRHREALQGIQHRLLGVTDVAADGHNDLVYLCFGQQPGSHFGVAFGTGC